MHCRVLALTSAAILAIFSAPAFAQIPTTDAGAIAELTALNVLVQTLNTSAVSMNTQLISVNRGVTSADLTLKAMQVMFNKPTPIVGRFLRIDGGARLNVAENVIDYAPTLRGEVSSSPSAAALLVQEHAEVVKDSADALLTGNGAYEVAERQRQTALNFQGQAYDDLRIYQARYTASDTMEAQLSLIPDIKSAVVYQAGLTLQVIKALNLLGQSISLNTAAVAEGTSYMLKEYFRIKLDHEATARTMGA